MVPAAESTLIEALQDPCRYDFPLSQVELVETHISWVLLTGAFAYKIKKPVDFGFVDFSTLEKRLVACRDELRLNRRLAPRLYQDVVPITGSRSEPVLGGRGSPIEYAVKIVQFPASARLDRVLQSGELLPRHINALAAELAEFHASAEVADPGAADHGTQYVRLPRFYQPIEQTLRSLCQLVGGHGDPLPAHSPNATEARHKLEIQQCLARLVPWMQTQFDRHAALFASRAQEGCIRECHGDLHLANMLLLDDKITLFDCLEFSAELRWIDVLNELAFAVMDLASRGRDDLSRRLASAYLEITGDYLGLPLFRYYLVYRALVRANVALLRGQQSGSAGDEDQHLWQECRDYLRLAQRYTTPPPARLLLTHGLSGSGKTVGTQTLVETIDAFRLRSDVERKRLFAGQGRGMYAPAANQATYARLAELAHAVIAAGFTAVIDATFLRRADRDLFRKLSVELQVPWAILQFDAPPELLRQRIRQRVAAGQDASDADLAVLEDQLRRQEPLGDDESPVTVRIDSAQPTSVERLISEIEAKATVPTAST